MPDAPSLNVRLYGTEQPPSASRPVEAGPLSALFEDGALRYVAIHGREAIRAISFVVRDQDWGTCAPRITDLELDAGDGVFRIGYAAECGDARQRLRYRADIFGTADGQLVFEVRGSAESPFLTNRTGFVVLHPVEGVAGQAVTVTHTDGSTEQSTFPGRVAPAQPFRDIRALRHEVAPGLFVTCTMEGDAYEMEDQRNWSDASYKTYIRPLAEPHPYTLEPGREFVQRVSLRAEGRRPAATRARRDDSVVLQADAGAAGTLPELALAVDPAYAAEALEAASLVRRSGVGWLVCTYDAGAGHDAGTLAQYRELAGLSGARLVLEAVLPLRGADGQFTDEASVLATDIAELQRQVDRAGVEFEVVSASPACYRKSWQPSGPWPSAPPLAGIYAALRRAFPGTRIAGGMHSYFTEFNRHPPPVEALDIVTHSTCPIVHAADDRSVMETLQALPWIFASARELAAGKPYWIGPTTIGMRFNPYGGATAPNPDNLRVAMATMDPRQRGLFNAAWTLAYIAAAAAGGVSGLCLSAAAGPGAVSWQAAQWPQPWFDGLRSAAAVFPVYAVIAGLGAKAGAELLPVQCTEPTLAALALRTGARTELWLANLGPAPQVVRLEGLGAGRRVERMDTESFEACCAGPGGFASTARALDSNELALDAYAVLRIA